MTAMTKAEEYGGGCVSNRPSLVLHRITLRLQYSTKKAFNYLVQICVTDLLWERLGARGAGMKCRAAENEKCQDEHDASLEAGNGSKHKKGPHVKRSGVSQQGSFERGLEHATHVSIGGSLTGELMRSAGFGHSCRAALVADHGRLQCEEIYGGILQIARV